MLYAEFPPVPRLAAIVERLWTLSGQAAGLDADTQPVLPDGRSELILHFGDSFDRVHPNGVGERQSSVIFAGQLTSQLLLRPTGRIAVLGVRFHPYGAAAVLRVPQTELAGLTIALDTIARPLSQALDDVRAATRNLDDAMARVQDALWEWIEPDRIDMRVRTVVQTIDRQRGLVSIDALAAQVSLTRRHLERRFLATVGMTPKRLARVARFQHALHVLEHSEAGRGSHTATTCGYADQAHFIRDFRELAGCPPGEHLLRHGELTGVFSGRQDRSLGSNRQPRSIVASSA